LFHALPPRSVVVVSALSGRLDSNVKCMTPLSRLDAAVDGSTDGFEAPASFRHPAEALGPRAQKTIGRIVEAAREAFLARGYAGTTIDEIARIADVSRASFYTYFPSKREILFAVGARGARESSAVIASLPDRPRTRAGMVAFVSDYWGFLDSNGSFALTWSQAAQEDEEVRLTGMKTHLGICREFGRQLAATAGREIDDPTLLGLSAWSLLEGNWRYAQQYAERIARDDMVDSVAQSLFAMVRAQR
jgi:AcrR family transcriptional regulator